MFKGLVQRFTRTTDQDVTDALLLTNVLSRGFPWNGSGEGHLKRWQLPIPVKANGEARAIAAMDKIEGKLKFKVFERTRIAYTPDADIPVGIVISVGTAYVPPGWPSCAGRANVSAGPKVGHYPAGFLNGFIIASRLYINIDNDECHASVDDIVHEFGHALGMGQHFDGFGGDGPATSSLFWAVLRTIYGNSPGTDWQSIAVYN